MLYEKGNSKKLKQYQIITSIANVLLIVGIFIIVSITIDMIIMLSLLFYN